VSTEQLKSDLKDNLASVKMLDPNDPLLAQKLLGHLKNCVWPFIEAHVDETAEIDEAVDELANGVDEVITFETGKTFVSTILGAQALVGQLKALSTGNVQALKAIAAWESQAEEALSIINEITLPEDYDEDADDKDDDADDDGDGDDDEDGDDAENDNAEGAQE